MTAIKITGKLKKRLDEMKHGRKISYNQVIEDLLDGNSYKFEEETVEKTGKIAFSVSYFSYDREELETYDVSFFELQNADVGMRFSADHVYNDRYFYEETAEILFKDDISAVVRVTLLDRTTRSEIIDAKLYQILFY